MHSKVGSPFRILLFALLLFLSACSDDGFKEPTLQSTFYYSVFDGKNWGVIDAEGNYVVESKYSSPPSVPFANGFLVESNGEYSHLDLEGKQVTSGQYNSASPYSESIAAVAKPGDQEAVFIDLQGEIVLREDYEAIAPFSEGLAAFRIDGLWGFVNSNGDLKVEQGWDSLPGPFINGIAIVRQKRRYGYIDTSGASIVDPSFKEAGCFFTPLARVKKGRNVGYINPTGEMVIDASFDDGFPFLGDLAPVNDAGEWGFINTDGEFEIDPEFEYAEPFVDGIALVETEDGFGYIDESGEYVIEPQFEKAGSFFAGMAPVKVKDKWGFIDTKGEFKIKAKFADVNLVSPYVEYEFAKYGRSAVTMSSVAIATARSFLEALYARNYEIAMGYATKSTRKFLEQIAENGYSYKWPDEFKITKQVDLSEKKVQVHYKTPDGEGGHRDELMTLMRVHGEWKVSMNKDEMTDEAIP